MMAEPYRLTKRQMARLAPLLPQDTRGVARVDDRRVISGIVHVLRSGCRWVDAPPAYGPRKTLYNRFVRWAAKGVWERVFLALAEAGGPPASILLDSSVMKAHRCAAGGKGGSEIRQSASAGADAQPNLTRLTDEHGRPRAFVLTGGQVADCRAAELLLDQVPPGVLLLADRGYDTDAIRAAVNSGGATPNIPPKTNRRFTPPFSPILYRARNAIERMFGRLKDFRRIATRYDKLATNFLAAVHLTAAVCYWL